ncbi:MAG: MBL fold metallo-hydrolase [Polyangiaceae bacterium]|jgi:phosphoribosyl 1,2-cyclic phosphodiesterase|nr:MBL fold metallo-hydrolase [Polyangiaceae bacterium]
MTFSIRFWGVRGSIAAPGPETATVGGNTSCVEVVCGASRFILDSGTGIRALGDALMKHGPVEATLLLSHHHWDHIQGLPFFTPIYIPTTKLTVVGPQTDRLSNIDVLEHQMSSPVFPVRLEELPCALETREVMAGDVLELGGARIRVAKANHPGGSLAYRIDYGGRSVVYATDTEHYSCVDPALRALALGADVLIYDSQYTPAEYRGECGPSKVGWGHSTYEDGAKLAHSADVGQYVLFHHDPRRNDEQVAHVERLAQSLFAGSVAAREGMVIELPARAVAA